jgi:hypothetical protein
MCLPDCWKQNLPWHNLQLSVCGLVHVQITPSTSETKSGRKVWQKHPGGPETVLVKARFCLKNSMALWWNAFFFIKNIKKMDSKIWAFSHFTTITAHVHRRVFVHSEKKKSEDANFCKVALRFIYLHCKQTETVLLTTTIVRRLEELTE